MNMSTSVSYKEHTFLKAPPSACFLFDKVEDHVALDLIFEADARSSYS